MVAGLASILDGDVQGAAPLVRQAERRRIATGVAPDDSVLLMACHAVIAQDAAALEAARVLGGWHTPPDAPIWKELLRRRLRHMWPHAWKRRRPVAWMPTLSYRLPHRNKPRPAWNPAFRQARLRPSTARNSLFRL